MMIQMTPLSLLHRSLEIGNGEWGSKALYWSVSDYTFAPVNVLHILKGYSSILYVKVWKLRSTE